MRKIFATILLCAGLSVAQAAPNVFNHLGIGAAVGTNGLSFEVATPITGFVNMRAGVSYMPGSPSMPMPITPIAWRQSTAPAR